ncbi:hypothetical protein CHS0354_026988 [Potamilus streckersoni]|uniref:CUB domain-containing protein n=1 Tax=Potamilus streckersoni TaxID=2493646 RepID=A0AAE0SDH6_9BIVA|nr:hypothetical protein CHS0354_026988 [Potamilus streckersoni]
MKITEVILSTGILVFWTISTVSGLKIYRMHRLCNKNISMTSDGINAARLVFSSSRRHDCFVIVVGRSRAPYIRFHFEKMDMGNETMNNECKYPKLQIKDGMSTGSPIVDGLPADLCGKTKPTGVYRTSTRFLRIEYDAANSLQINVSLSIIFNSFYTGTCKKDEYTCSNGHCIAEELVCKGHNPCGDQSDCRLSAGAIVGIVLGVCVGLGIFISCIVAYIRFIHPRKNLSRSPLNAQAAVVIPNVTSANSNNQCYHDDVLQLQSGVGLYNSPPPYSEQLKFACNNASHAQFVTTVDYEDNPPPYTVNYVTATNNVWFTSNQSQLMSYMGYEDHPPPYS